MKTRICFRFAPSTFWLCLINVAHLITVVFVCSTCAVSATPPQVIIAYPPNNKTVAFGHVILSGSVPRGATLKINDRVLDVAPDGLFIEWWPLEIGENVLQLASTLNGETARRELRVTRTVPSAPSNPINAAASTIVYETPRVGVVMAQPIGLGVNAGATAARNGVGRSHILQIAKDTKFVVVGEEGETFRCALSSTQTVNIQKSQMQLLPVGTTLPRVYFSRIETRKIQTSSTRTGTQVRFDLPERVPFQIVQNATANEQSFDVRLFHVESDVDYLVSAFPDDLVQSVTWRQEHDGVFLARIVLKNAQQWGYFARYENNTLVLTIKDAPPISRRKPMSGLRVLVDAGHGGSESGAGGAFGVNEKDLVLPIALRLAELLKKRGAIVTLSRDRDVTVPLYDRALLAERVNADISVSVHANALPDGVDPRTQRGAGVYYFQPQSRSLAKTLQSALLRDLPEVGNDGLHFQNLALTRPSTQLSVLVETAFMTDKENLRLLMSERGRERFAQSLARGLEEFARRQTTTSTTR